MDNDDEKYVFRFYKTFPGDTHLYSPYITNPSRIQGHNPNKVNDDKTTGGSTVDDDYLLVNGNKVRDTTNARHVGLSTIGMRDNAYSMYTPYDLLNEALTNKPSYYDDDYEGPKSNGIVYNPNIFKKAFSPKVNKLIYKYAKELSPELYDKLMSGKPIAQDKLDRDAINTFSLLRESLYNLGSYLNNAVTTDKSKQPMFMLTDSGYKPTKLSKYRGLVSSIENTGENLADNLEDDDPSGYGNIELWLAKAPLSSFITNKELDKNNYSPQRDFPEEILTKRVIPVRGKKATEILSKFRNGQPEPFGVLHDVDELFNAFGIEPNRILSDENMKQIHSDLAKTARGYLSQHSITKACNNRW